LKGKGKGKCIYI